MIEVNWSSCIITQIKNCVQLLNTDVFLWQNYLFSVKSFFILTFYLSMCVCIDMYVFMNTYPILAWFFLQAGLGSKDVKGVSRHRRGEGVFQIGKLFTADSSSKRLVMQCLHSCHFVEFLTFSRILLIVLFFFTNYLIFYYFIISYKVSQYWV